MKAIIGLSALVGVLAISAGSGAERSEGFSLTWENAPLTLVLEACKNMAKEAGIRVVAASQMDRLEDGAITLSFSGSAEAAMKRVEQVLLEQAAVVVTPLSGKRVSMTFNDTLARELHVPVHVAPEVRHHQ